jgi:hypothetical protein
MERQMKEVGRETSDEMGKIEGQRREKGGNEGQGRKVGKREGIGETG